ncbi:hypothetical protein [Pelosinus sp. IPA-1]|uniref:hypothetical protein n=1 Tax=Pelosinus sp. IPA-1 TaxID=3029569 RepID=UPI002436164D|nr:hypothetical protein [Pelosinus sp. IPA-1]GMA99080.1 hypothetical protein PIPA1_18800 [Pelosinus sp. IPA-1]
MRGKFIVIILLLTVMLGGCTEKPLPFKAGLSIVTEDETIKWGLPNQLLQQGAGNSYRILKDEGQGTNILELAAGSNGSMEYFVEVEANDAAVAHMRLEFLSTQGGGRIRLAALDQKGNILGEKGSVFTGKIPTETKQSKWQDIRYNTNYQGGWLEETYSFSDILKSLNTGDLAGVAKYRLSVEVSEGQHALITQFSADIDSTKAVRVIPKMVEYTANLGDVFPIEMDIENITQNLIPSVEAMLQEPFGYGVIAISPEVQVVEQLAPGEKRHLSFQVRAQRPDAVNLNQAWPIQFSINGKNVQTKVGVAVRDTRPGKVFYVMTEDLEPIDGAGYAKAWGNSDSWLEPEEFRGQMVNKAEAIDKIAERYGAKWTHYIAWPAVKAAEWAAGQSKTGEWPKVVADIKASVLRETQKGHEYGIHFHTDYDPYLPGNVLSYNESVDGLWANHLKHGWAHSITTEGDFSDYNSRTGMLYEYQRILDQIAASSSQGQLLTARAGSFDFGNGSADEAMSTNAFKKAGLWGSSDADGNAGGLTSGDYGQEIYFAAPDDINTPGKDIRALGIVEFRPTPRQSIAYDSQSAAVMNQKTDQGMKYFTNSSGNVKPGIHSIVGFTHAMFMMGQGDWKSLEGGQFQALDEHLSYVKNQYASSGLLAFGTASELVEAYLDYYTPELLAIYGPRQSDKYGVAEYAIHVLGHDIPTDGNHIHNVGVKYPLYLRDSAYRISVLKNGQPIYSTWGLPTPYNDIFFVVDDKSAVYTLKIYHNELVYKLISKFHVIKEKIFKKK